MEVLSVDIAHKTPTRNTESISRSKAYANSTGRPLTAIECQVQSGQRLRRCCAVQLWRRCLDDHGQLRNMLRSKWRYLVLRLHSCDHPQAQSLVRAENLCYNRSPTLMTIEATFWKMALKSQLEAVPGWWPSIGSWTELTRLACWVYRLLFQGTGSRTVSHHVEQTASPLKPLTEQDPGRWNRRHQSWRPRRIIRNESGYADTIFVAKTPCRLLLHCKARVSTMSWPMVCQILCIICYPCLRPARLM